MTQDNPNRILVIWNPYLILIIDGKLKTQASSAYLHYPNVLGINALKKKCETRT